MKVKNAASQRGVGDTTNVRKLERSAYLHQMPECPIKVEFLKDIQTAMGELMSIHNNEVVALLAEDFDRVTQLKTTLHAVRERKARLIELYREHVIGHCC